MKRRREEENEDVKGERRKGAEKGVKRRRMKEG